VSPREEVTKEKLTTLLEALGREFRHSALMPEYGNRSLKAEPVRFRRMLETVLRPRTPDGR